MSEICHNCPISSTELCAPILNTIAARMAEITQVHNESWIETAYELFDNSTDDQDPVEKLIEANDLSPEKVETARKCAQQILWKQCDFNNLV